MPKRPIIAEDLLKIQYVGDPQISPDGQRVLFYKKHVNDKNKYISNLFTVDLDGKVQQWTQGEGGAGSGRWSPDGSKIAFISGREKPAPQIFILPVEGGEARALTKLPEGSIGGFKWSPDGNKMAFTFREQHPHWTEAAKKERQDKGLSDPPMELEDVWYRLDGDGYFMMQRYKLYLLDVQSAEHKLLDDTSPLGNYEFDWNPNSSELAVIHSAAKRPMADPPNDQIFRINLEGQKWQIPGLPTGSKDRLAWSPDGKWLAYTGDVDENDPWGTRNSKLYLVNADGGEPRNLTGNTDYDFGASTVADSKEGDAGTVLNWSPDCKHIYTQMAWHGETQLAVVDVKDGSLKILTNGRHLVFMGNLSSEGNRAAVFSGDATHPMEIGYADLKPNGCEVRILTHFNKELLDEIIVQEPEEIWLDSTDGAKVHAWVIKPVGYMEPKRYPAVLVVHGGPHLQYGWTFFHEFQVLAAQGYVVVYSNPRGSKGYGEAHCAAIRGDWGNKDWDDIQAVTHWMQHQPYIHPGQIGIMGGSYGGYMTNWAVSHSDAYKSGITDRCVSNMVSMAGNSDFPFNKNGYFKGYAWGDTEAIKCIWEQSPLAYFDKVKAPMLIIHSEGDLRCNIEQSEQVFTALQQQGIESRFVRYPRNSSHGMSRNGPPDLRLHRLGEIVKWWKGHL